MADPEKKDAGPPEISSESEVRKELEEIKEIIFSFTKSTEIRNKASKIASWYNTNSHRILRSACYPLLKASHDLDWPSIVPYISDDIISNDIELHLNALKLLQKLPKEQAIYIVKKHDKDFSKLFATAEWHFERLNLIHDFLIKLYLKNCSGDYDPDCQEIIKSLYVKISELPFSGNKDFAKNSIEIFIKLYEIYINSISDLNNLSFQFEGNGQIRNLIRPLVMRLNQIFLKKVEDILQIISSFEARIRVHLLKFLFLILESLILNEEKIDPKSPFFGENIDNFSISMSENYYLVKQDKDANEQNIREIQEKIMQQYILDLLNSNIQEIDILEHCQNIFQKAIRIPFLYPNFHKKSQIISDFVTPYLFIIENNNYKKEQNIFTANLLLLAAEMNSTFRLAFSWRVIELVSKNIPHSSFLLKFFTELCFQNIIESSIYMMTNDLSIDNPMIGIQQFDWFVKKLKDSADPKEAEPLICYRHEFAIGLLSAGIQIFKNMKDNIPSNFQLEKKFFSNELIEKTVRNKIQEKTEFEIKIFFDLLELAYRLINWHNLSAKGFSVEISQNQNLVVSLYIYLFQLLAPVLEKEQISQQGSEIIKRINASETKFPLRIRLASFIAKNFKPNNFTLKLDSKELLKEAKIRLTQKPSESAFNRKYLQALQQNNALFIRETMEEIEALYIFLAGYAEKQDPDDNQFKNDIVSFLIDFNEYLSKIRKDKSQSIQMIDMIIENNEKISSFLMSGTSVFNSDFEINREKIAKIMEEQELNIQSIHEQQENPFKLLSFNAFQLINPWSISEKYYENNQIMHENLENENLMRNLMTLSYKFSTESELNSMFKEPILINGQMDFINIYASFAILKSKMLIAICLKIVNKTSLELRSLEVKLNMSSSTEIMCEEENPLRIFINEFAPNSTRQVNFAVRYKEFKTPNVCFDVTVENENGQAFCFKTMNFKINLSNFLIPHYFANDSESFFLVFDRLWYGINLKGSFSGKKRDEILQKIHSKNQCIIDLKENKAKQVNLREKGSVLDIGILGISFDGALFGMRIQCNKLPEIAVEIRMDMLRYLADLRENAGNFLFEFFKETVDFE